MRSFLFQSSRADGDWLARDSMYMLRVPGTSTSQADGMRSLLIILMMVQGTMPKYSSKEVQHWTALTVTLVCFIQPSMTAPSLAIFNSAVSGIPEVVT